MEKLRFGCVRRHLWQAWSCVPPQKKLLTKTRGSGTGSAGNVFLAERLHRVVSLLRGLRWLLCVLGFLTCCGVLFWVSDLGVEPGTSPMLPPKTAQDAE